jgi:hypothetical protein
MIVFVSTRGNGYTLRSIADGKFGVPTPKFRLAHYGQLFRRRRLPRATYIFGDLERLADWELRLAAELYRGMVEAGLRCLNDPARAMARIELLTTLAGAGINPFSAYRADESPRPRRFPVFIRSEYDHLPARPDLYHGQAELDAALEALRASGVPLRGQIVVEQCTEPYREGLWAKWGLYRIGEAMVLEHVSVDDTWLVKIGDAKKKSEEIVEEEWAAIRSNRFASELKPAFALGGIEFGRADLGVVAGRPVVYEINTNPSLGPWPKRKLVSLAARNNLHARKLLADALGTIDSEAGGSVRLPPSPLIHRVRWWSIGFVTPRRR